MIISAPRMKMRREHVEHVVPLSRQALKVLDVVRTLIWRGPLVFPNSRWAHRPMSKNAIGYLLNRSGYAGRHVPHGFRTSFSSIMNEQRPDDRQIIDQMLAHVSKNQVEAACNRVEYRGRKHQLAQDWADMLLDGFCHPGYLLSNRHR